MDTMSSWESSVGVAKRKAALFILETLFRRYGASAQEITRLRERAASFEEFRASESTVLDVKCPICQDFGPKDRLKEHLRGHIQAEVDEATRSARAQITKLINERDQAIDRTRSLTADFDRIRRELDELKQRVHANDFVCPICIEPVLKETAMAPDCGHAVCQKCETSWTAELEAHDNLGYRCPTCSLHSTPVRLF